MTYVWTDEGWLYLAVILDLFARKVVGWATSAVNDTALATAALDAALIARRPPTRPGRHHSDRGSPYASVEYRAALMSRGIVASMSRTGDCWDNAVAESFFATIKAELIDLERFSSRGAATASIAEYIECFYNPQRRHSFLGFLSPIEFELKAHVAALAAESNRPRNRGNSRSGWWSPPCAPLISGYPLDARDGDVVDPAALELIQTPL